MARARTFIVRLAKYGAVGLLALLLAGIGYQALGRAVDVRRFPPPGERVDVGEGHLHVHCSGEGSPTVILDAGGGDTSLAWWNVQSQVAASTRVCSFDRMGFGWSDEFALPHTSENYVDLQERMMRHAGIDGPYVLVGHSLGGLNAQLFASRHPERVAGMVLVDSAHPELYERVPQLAGFDDGFVNMMRVLARLGVARFVLELGLADPLEGTALSDEARARYRAEYARPRHWDSTHAMGASLDETLAQGRDVGPLPDVPAVVITHGVPDQFDAIESGDAEQHWQALQAELAREFPQGRLVVAENSGHMIPLEAPATVVRAIEAVLP